MAKGALQVGRQLIPPGLLVTVPTPVPTRLTVNTGPPWTALKVAVTFSFELSVTTQVGLLLHPPPLQLANNEFAPGVAVSVTFVPAPKPALQVVPQLIPDGLLVTVPVPVPARPTVNI